MEFVGITTWGVGISSIELDAYCSQTFLHKILASRALSCEITNAVRFYKSNQFGKNIFKFSLNTSLIKKNG